MQPILIAPFKTGLNQNIEPWLAPIDSFEVLKNFHIRHGYLQKRQGYKLYARMVRNPTATITGVTQANPAVVTATNTFSNTDQILITNVGGMTELNGNIYTVAARTASDFELSGIDSSGFTAYTSGGRAAIIDTNPIIGIANYVESDNTKTTLVFNTERAAYYDDTNNVLNPLDTANIMSASNSDFIWSDNWQHRDGRNRLYFTNGKPYDGVSVDGIRYYDPGTSTTATTAFRPSLTSPRVLYGCKLLFAFKERLLVLNTYEYNGSSTVHYPQRMRWCALQDPSNWQDTVAGGGSFADAATGQHIVSAQQIQDVIIVFFTNSVWSIRYTGDPARPFRWFKINNFRACDGKMASTSYDRYAVAIGVRGITATDGVETRRIDDRIHDFVTDSINRDNFKKVFCKRDYSRERFWSLYPNLESTNSNYALIYDDDSSAFSNYEISMNCLGYGQNGFDYGLNDFNNEQLNDYANETLQSFFWQDNQELFIGGTNDGVVYILNTENNDDGTEIECELLTNAWNPYQNQGIETALVYLDILVDTDTETQIKVEFYKDSETIPYQTQYSDILPPLKYITSISNITQANPAQVTCKSHGLSTGNSIYIYGVKGMESIYGGYSITVVDDNNITLDGIDSTSFSAYTTGGQVLGKEFRRTKSWKRILAGGVGFQHRVKITSSGLNDPLIIEAFKPYFKQIGSRTIN